MKNPILLLISIEKLKNKTSKNHRGISPIISTLLILAIITVGIVIGFLQIIPYVEQSKIESGISSIQGGMNEIENTIFDLVEDNGGFRIVYLNKPFGSMKLVTDRDYIHFRVRNSTNTLSDINSFEPLTSTTISGKIEYETTTDYDIIPDNSSKYLSGIYPYNNRPGVVTIDPYNSDTQTGYMGMNNLVMNRIDNKITIDLNYRPKIIIYQPPAANSNITIEIQQILLRLDFTSSSTNYLALNNGNNQIGFKLAVQPTVQSFVGTSDSEVFFEYQNTGNSPGQGTWSSVWSSNTGGLVNFKMITYQIDLISYIY